VVGELSVVDAEDIDGVKVNSPAGGAMPRNSPWWVP
jgi:hypothetical protein